MSLRDDVIVAVRIVSENSNGPDQVIVDRLAAEGYELLHAELLAVFVPLGLGRALIERMDFHPAIQLSNTAIIVTTNGTENMEIPLTLVPEFSAALQLGRETFKTGVIPREQFSAASSIGVEIKLINDILNSSKQVEGSTISAPVLTRLAKTPGFDEWRRHLGRPNNRI